MNARTNTNCKECMHRKVCGKLGKPEQILEKIKLIVDVTEEGAMDIDTTGIDTVVSCVDFHKEYPVDKIVYRNPINLKPMREDGK